MQSIPKNIKTVSFREGNSSYPILEIHRKECDAEIALHGGHLLSWTPSGEEPVIYTSSTAIFKEGTAIRGGIPICWPWFNAHPTDPSLPSHGIARNRFWKLAEVSEDITHTTIKLHLDCNDQTQAIWDEEFSLEATIILGATLEVSLQTINQGATPITVGGALHTYLNVSDINNISIHGLENTQYIDTVGEETLKRQEGSVKIQSEVDRIYVNTTDDILLKDSGYNRSLKVSRKGSSSAVVWNPWVDKALSLKDLPNDAYKQFVCIEATNAKTDTYSLDHLKSHTLTTKIEVI